MDIKIKQYGRTFKKSNVKVEEEIIKKTKKFDWYFKFNQKPTQSDSQKLNSVKKQIAEQYDCNEREKVYSINC